jgi:hypothetical protein
MPGRTASVFVCDDVLVSLNGKFNILGMYTGDTAIFAEHPFQLVFVFQIECDLDDPYRSLTLQVLMPGEEQPRQMPVTFATPIVAEGRSRWALRYPFLVQTARLQPGRIEAKVIHDKGEIIAGYHWVVMTSLPSLNPPTTH